MGLYVYQKKWICFTSKSASTTHGLTLRPCRIWPQGLSGSPLPLIYFPLTALVFLLYLEHSHHTLTLGLTIPIGWDILPPL